MIVLPIAKLMDALTTNKMTLEVSIKSGDKSGQEKLLQIV